MIDMNMVITKFGSTPLSLNYEDKDLAKIVDDYISGVKGTFRYSYLCNHIENLAMQQGKFNTEPYTRYTEIALTEHDHHRINMILWQMIWERKIVISFRNGLYNQNKSNDTLFEVVEDKWKK